jgi:hypothetical protein
MYSGIFVRGKSSLRYLGDALPLADIHIQSSPVACIRLRCSPSPNYLANYRTAYYAELFIGSSW